MSVDVNVIYKNVLFKLKDTLKDDLLKLARNEFKGRYKGYNEQEKVVIEFKGKDKIYLFSQNTSKLSDAIKELINFFSKNKIEYKTTFSIILIAKTINSQLDSIDILNDIFKVDIMNVNGILNLSNKMLIVYNNIGYLFEVEVKSLTDLQIIIQKEADVEESCNVFEELKGVYYNTLHLSINI